MSTPPYSLPYDQEGILPSNLFANEIHNVSPPADPLKASFIVPRGAPFFHTGLVVKTGPAPTDPTLTEGVDYQLTHKFVEASQYLSKPIYGSINFVDRNYTGTVYITYQSLGGAYTLADYSIVEALTRSLYNLRTVTWTQIVGLPAAFPPLPHPHDTADLTGMADVVVAIQALVTAINANGANIGSLSAAFANHLTQLGSHSKAQVGLSNVPNWGEATQADIDNQVANKIVPPSLLAYAITRFNTIGVTVNDATEVLKGILRLATLQESIDGDLGDVAVTPAGLEAFFNQFLSATQIQVGDLYFTTVQTRDPAVFLGYGQWSRFAQGKMLVSYDPTNPRFDTAGNTGGEEKHVLTNGELPTNNVVIRLPTRDNVTGGNPLSLPGLVQADYPFGYVDVVANAFGNDEPHENMPPFIVVCIWIRVS